MCQLANDCLKRYSTGVGAAWNYCQHAKMVAEVCQASKVFLTKREYPRISNLCDGQTTMHVSQCLIH